eukprot:g17871.t1
MITRLGQAETVGTLRYSVPERMEYGYAGLYLGSGPSTPSAPACSSALNTAADVVKRWKACSRCTISG